MTSAAVPTRRLIILTFIALLTGLASGVRAQIIEVPPFVVEESDSDYKLPIVVAAGADSSMVFAWRARSQGEHTRIFAQRFSSLGAALADKVRLDITGDGSDARILATPQGGFLASWRRFVNQNVLDARPLDATGTPTAPPVTLLAGPTAHAGSMAAPLSSGTVVVWNATSGMGARRLDLAGQPSGPDIVVHPPGSGSSMVNVAGTADGGFVVIWADGAAVLGRVYDAAGAPVSDALTLAGDLEPAELDLVASPLGGFVIAGANRTESQAYPSGVWVRRFDATGAFLTERLVDALPPGFGFTAPRAAFDPAGRLVVSWEIGSEVQARAYDPAGVPIGPQFDPVGIDVVGGPSFEARPDGRFVLAWYSFYSQLNASVLGLCVPPAHTGCGNGVVEQPCERCDEGPANSDTDPNACRTGCYNFYCGDGVVDAGEDCEDGNNRGCDGCDADCDLEVGWICGDGILSDDCGEQCDDGGFNDDGTPDACRTNCQFPSCGDGVQDSDEACDDGNRTSCDGCSDGCVLETGLVCGDGIPELLCGEECDDGNTIVGDGCTEPCQLERILGGGSPLTDCKVAWSVDNPANDPLYDKKGAVNGTQVCVDGDPRCDFDAVAGQCTFHLKVCVNNSDSELCSPGPRLRSWELRAPSEKKAAKRPELAAIRAAFAGVPGQIVGPTTLDLCSETLAVPVSVKTSASGAKPGKQAIKSYATLYTGEKDGDKLTLICAP